MRLYICRTSHWQRGDVGGEWNYCLVVDRLARDILHFRRMWIIVDSGVDIPGQQLTRGRPKDKYGGKGVHSGVTGTDYGRGGA